MRSLNEFAQPREVFTTPTYLPPFFDENLVDPARVVKVFQDDPQAHIRVFYYQYLKLCFEVNHPNSEALVQKIEELINNPTFQFIFYQEDDPSVFNDNQAKRLISQFFGILSSGQITVLQAINAYPIMDTIMVHFFRTLMILMDKAQSLDNFIPRDQLLSFLCSFFGIEVELHDSCIKYIDTDVFVYDHSEQEVYMAYINYTEQPESQPPTYQENQNKYLQIKQEDHFAPISTVSNPAPAPNTGRAPSSSVGAGKESYIASQFFDYTQDIPSGGLANKGTTLKGSDHFINPVASSEVQDVKPAYTEPKPSPSIQQSSSTGAIGNSFQYQEITAKTNHNQTYNQYQYLPKVTNTASQPQLYAPPSTPASMPSTNQFYQPSKPTSTYQIHLQQTVPTKDYTYNQSSNNTSSQTNQYASTYTSQASKPVETIPTPPAPKPSSYGSAPAKDLFYAPKEAPLYNPKIVNQPYSSGYQAANKAGIQANATTGVAGVKKKVFGLNVSQEFTNSLTIKSMAEPHKTNVINIKSRARNFRSSLANFVK